ncbi:hypothetical protein SS05631_b50370 (plasmid) [Sinorhizobium sp. CCBAU 05631]|nr:hypothetical protein SS05631_b50370 [Sinorhizobium sp. CCBAU 05631]
MVEAVSAGTTSAISTSSTSSTVLELKAQLAAKQDEFARENRR